MGLVLSHSQLSPSKHRYHEIVFLQGNGSTSFYTHVRTNKVWDDEYKRGIYFGHFVQFDLVHFGTLLSRFHCTGRWQTNIKLEEMRTTWWRKLQSKQCVPTSCVSVPDGNFRVLIANIFLRPSYTAFGVNTSGATTVWSCVIRSMLSLAGSVFSEGVMTINKY